MLRKMKSLIVPILFLVILSMVCAPCINASASTHAVADFFHTKQKDDKHRTKIKNTWVKANQYLVLVEQSDGKFKAYDDLALVTAGNYLMVKAKPIAGALGLTYTNGNGKKKGCIIARGQEKNVYTRNSKTYYYYDGKSGKAKTYTADYKQSVLQSYNTVHYKTMGTLVKYKFFNTAEDKAYSELGFGGVVVYYKSSNIVTDKQSLPSLTQVTNLKEICPDWEEIRCPVCKDDHQFGKCPYYSWIFKDDDYDFGDLLHRILCNGNHSLKDCPYWGWLSSGKDGDNDDDSNDDDEDQDDDDSSNVTKKVTVEPVYVRNDPGSTVAFVEAAFTDLNSTGELILNLDNVQDAFRDYGLPYDGIYGFGTCESSITIKGINRYGKTIGQISTGGKDFTLDFPEAEKLIITGTRRNLMLDFTPVKPIVISSATNLPLLAINWLYPKDSYARQYFVIGSYMQVGMENVILPYTLSRKTIDYNSTSSTNYTSSYQRVTIVFKGTITETYNYNQYIAISEARKAVSHPLVDFYDNGLVTLPQNYETELLNMIASLISSGYNIYYPGKNWESKLIIRLADGSKVNYQDYIMLTYSDIDLDYFYDYYVHLHEMVHFYESSQPHYGLQFQAWSEGNAITLAQKAYSFLNRNTDSSSLNDLIDAQYDTEFEFLTSTDKRNFENYYLNVEGQNASIIGYHFTNFLQEWYGTDVISRIITNINKAGIPMDSGRTTEYDRKFTKCIKDATSDDVFNLFVYYCVD